MTNETGTTMSSHDDQIRALLATYERALNTSDAALAASCYTPDGIFMPTALPTAQGAGMEEAYRRIFAAIRLEVTFAIDELVVTSDHSPTTAGRSPATCSTRPREPQRGRGDRPALVGGQLPWRCSTSWSTTVPQPSWKPISACCPASSGFWCTAIAR